MRRYGQDDALTFAGDPTNRPWRFLASVSTPTREAATRLAPARGSIWPSTLLTRYTSVAIWPWRPGRCEAVLPSTTMEPSGCARATFHAPSVPLASPWLSMTNQGLAPICKLLPLWDQILGPRSIPRLCQFLTL